MEDDDDGGRFVLGCDRDTCLKPSNAPHRGTRDHFNVGTPRAVILDGWFSRSTWCGEAHGRVVGEGIPGPPRTRWDGRLGLGVTSGFPAVGGRSECG